MSEYESEDYDLSFKLVLVGDVFVGKTSLLDRFQSSNLYSLYPDAKLPRPPPTVGLSSRQHTLTIRGMQIQLSIWDTAGQERFNSLVKMYYRDVQCGIVVFDVTNPRALARLSIWIQPLKEGAVEHAVFILIANKIDGERKVSTEQGYAFAKANGMMYAETSAITGQGVDAAFLSAVEELVKRAVDDRTLAVNQPIPEMDGRNKKTKESSSTTSISQIQFRTERPSSCC